MNPTLGATELGEWLGKDATEAELRLAALSRETPISLSTLNLMKKGRYLPAPRTLTALRSVMAKFPLGKPIPDSLGVSAVPA